eukprot:TRINITY_DN92897_c0_g1_i1.p1 TRINITY_DN92897_c0_g1~~TRINITY_DN92897_c0_g1_i1.p1  ORF type:complete len:187 (+),score=24.53 TRINITY_DN92897_c0_g1_i1:639-1199(+)
MVIFYGHGNSTKLAGDLQENEITQALRGFTQLQCVVFVACETFPLAQKCSRLWPEICWIAPKAKPRTYDIFDAHSPIPVFLLKFLGIRFKLEHCSRPTTKITLTWQRFGPEWKVVWSSGTALSWAPTRTALLFLLFATDKFGVFWPPETNTFFDTAIDYGDEHEQYRNAMLVDRAHRGWGLFSQLE